MGTTKAWIVDDDQIFIDIVLMMSQKAPPDLEFSVFYSGRSFLDAIAQASPAEEPDVIILDITMPDLSGWDVLDGLRNMGWTSKHQTPIHLITSSVTREERIHARTYPEVKQYVIKPINTEYLTSLVTDTQYGN